MQTTLCWPQTTLSISTYTADSTRCIVCELNVKYINRIVSFVDEMHSQASSYILMTPKQRTLRTIERAGGSGRWNIHGYRCSYASSRSHIGVERAYRAIGRIRGCVEGTKRADWTHNTGRLAHGAGLIRPTDTCNARGRCIDKIVTARITICALGSPCCREGTSHTRARHGRQARDRAKLARSAVPAHGGARGIYKGTCLW